MEVRDLKKKLNQLFSDLTDEIHWYQTSENGTDGFNLNYWFETETKCFNFMTVAAADELRCFISSEDSHSPIVTFKLDTIKDEQLQMFVREGIVKVYP